MMTNGRSLKSLGKCWGLRRLADARGHFLMLATDQRTPLVQMLARLRGCEPEAVSFADIIAVKRLLVEVLSPHASATLTDPNYSYPATIDVLRPNTGLLIALEEHRFGETSQGRCSSSIPGWSVDRIKRVGADGVKLLVWYRPDAGPEVQAHQQAYVRQVGRDCAANDIPFILELLSYPLASGNRQETARAEDPAHYASLVIDSVREFARPEYGVDLLKLESPVPAAALPAEDDAAGSARVQALFDELGRATSGLPWVMLSAGAAKAQFRRVMGFAYSAGANGFLAGRAIWADAIAAFPDLDSCRAELHASGVPYMRDLAALTADGAATWHCNYADLRRIEREGEFVAAVPALAATDDDQ
jgi:tagatose 1,6-diphosphate aldolase